jgi:hypothetical protein
MNTDAIINALAVIIAAIIGALVPLLALFIRDRQARENQLYKFVYIKVYHLTPMAEGKTPVYKKHIGRLNTDVEVFDESHFFRLNVFRKPQQNFPISDRSSGTVDMQILYPWQDLQFSDKGAEKEPRRMAQIVKEPSNVFFTRTMYFNGFQPGNEDFAMKMEKDTEEARMLIDFSSIPKFNTFVKEGPKGILRRGNIEKHISVITDAAGVYSVNATSLKEDDVIRLDFAIDWDAVGEQSGTHTF